MKHHKILRQGLSVLVSLVMCLSLLPTTALASTSVEINETNFPDENFRTYVSEKFDTDDNKGTLSAEEIAKVTNINCFNKSISDLKGIEYFTALTTLNCSFNQLTSLDISKNVNLSELDCTRSNLTSLDVSNTAVWSTHLSPNTYKVTLSENRTFDLSTLPGNFNVTKVLSWDGGTVEGNILTFDPGVTIVTYIYDCGIGKKQPLRWMPLHNTLSPLIPTTVRVLWSL